jgi:Rod binding domain-containing protein
MLNSGSCDAVEAARARLYAAELQEALRTLPGRASEEAAVEQLRAVSRDFASLFYSMFVRQMQRTLHQDEEDDGPIRQGVEDFMSMFLPQEAARQADDALAAYIFRHLRARHGELLNESA